MSDRSGTWDLRLGLGLYRWGDDRPTVQEVFPDAGYAVYGNVYAFQRVFGVEGLFGAVVPKPLRDVFAYVDPLAPEVLFDGIPTAAARALLDAVGCETPIGPDEVEWCVGDARVIFFERDPGEVWLKVEGPKSLAAALDEEFGSDNELLDDRYD